MKKRRQTAASLARRSNWKERAADRFLASMSNTKAVDGDGDLCPRCKRPGQIREHVRLTPELQKKPFYYARWFHCRSSTSECPVGVFYGDDPERYRVYNGTPPAKKKRWHVPVTEELDPRIVEQLSPPPLPRARSLSIASVARSGPKKFLTRYTLMVTSSATRASVLQNK